jgi:hypothetical protein
VPEVSAPPEERTVTPSPGVDTVADEDVDDAEACGFGPSEAACVADVVESDEVVDESVSGDADSFDDGDVLVDVVAGSSAHATPGLLATAPPMPSATARAPTRPTYLAYGLSWFAADTMTTPPGSGVDQCLQGQLSHQ